MLILSCCVCRCFMPSVVHVQLQHPDPPPLLSVWIEAHKKQNLGSGLHSLFILAPTISTVLVDSPIIFFNHTSVFPPRVTQLFLSCLFTILSALKQALPLHALPLCPPPAGQHRLLLQLRKRGPSRVPMRGVQGAAQSIIRDKQWAQWEGQGECVCVSGGWRGGKKNTSAWWLGLDALNALHLWTCQRGPLKAPMVNWWETSMKENTVNIQFPGLKKRGGGSCTEPDLTDDWNKKRVAQTFDFSSFQIK